MNTIDHTVPADSIHPASFRSRFLDILRRPGVIVSIFTVVVLRVWFGFLGALVVVGHPGPIIPNPPTMYHGLERVPDSGLGLLLSPWQRWDAIWYLRIAQFGYSPSDESASFFPLYPILIRLGSWLTGFNYLLAALLISTLATIFSIYFIYRWSADAHGHSVAMRSILYWAVFPTAFFLLSPYAESVLVACSSASLYWWKQKRIPPAALAAAGAALSRPVGFLIVIPFLIDLCRPKASTRERAEALLPISAVAMGMAGWMLYLQVTFNDALLWMHAEQSWQRVFVFPGATLWWTWQDILSGRGAVANEVVDLTLTVVVLVAILAGLKKLPLSISLYALAMAVVPLLNYAQASGYALDPLAAAGRRALVVFPAFISLAIVWQGKWKSRILVGISAISQALLFAVYVYWLWID